MAELKTYRGNCHCGAYVFEAKLPEVTSMNLCNCSICYRKAAIWVLPKTGDLTWVHGDLGNSKSYAFNTKSLAHKFCGTCGVPIAVVGHFAPLKEGEIKDPDAAVNLRTFQHGTIPSLWDMEATATLKDWASIGQPYKQPEFTGPKPKKEVEGGKLYTGSCHCGDVKVAMWSKPLDSTFDEPVYECNCSGCIRAGGSCAYPHMDSVVVEGEENTAAYAYGPLKAWEKYFCKNCGVFIGRRPLPVPDEIVAKLPDMAKQWTVDIHHLRPINLKIMNDVDLKELKKIVHIDGYDNIPPPYENP